MRLPGRIAAAIEVLADLHARHRPASEALRDWGVSHRFAGAGDRAAIGNLVYDALRRRASHAFAMGQDTPRALALSVAVRDWGEAPDALDSQFAEDRFAPERLTEAEMARLGAADALDGAPDHIRADVPEWLAPDFQKAFGESWIDEGRGLTGRPPLDMRVNRLKADRDRVAASLKRFSPQPTTIAPDGLRIAAGERDARTPNVQTDQAFIKGWFEIQDQGSQIVSLLAGAAPGEQVLDFCAGGGGKTLAMAAMMGNRGQIYAHDSDRNRLAPIYDRLKRAGARNVQVRPPDPDALDGLEGRLDRVLVDAPCTGTGTWRRRPDAKWRLSPDQLAARRAEQADILAAATRYVKPGGALVYITCSLLPEENDAQIAGFVARFPQFVRKDPASLWSAAFATQPDTKRHISPFGSTLTPRATGTDGFYIAVLAREGSST